MSKLEGSCLCGAVRYDSDAEPLAVVACHCDNCQRQSGTAFSIIVAVPDGAVTVSGEENVKEFLDSGDSGKEVHRRFCGECGSPLFTLADVSPGLFFIKAGTLNDRSWLKPTTHYWCDTKQPWLDLDPAADTVARNPPLG